MKKYWPIAVIIILVLIAIFWDRIKLFLGMYSNSTGLQNIPAIININYSSLVGRNLKVTNPTGIYAMDIAADGCLTEKDPRVLIPVGTTSPILEIKANYSGCVANAPKTPTWVRTIYGWFSLESTGLQII